MRLSVIYATPLPLLLRILSSADITELKAADALGLLPDPWLQTGTIAATVANVMGGARRVPEDYRPAAKLSVPMEGAEELFRRRYGNNRGNLGSGQS